MLESHARNRNKRGEITHNTKGPEGPGSAGRRPDIH